MIIFHGVKRNTLSMMAILLWVLLPGCQNKGKSKSTQTNKPSATAHEHADHAHNHAGHAHEHAGHAHEHADHAHADKPTSAAKTAPLDQKLGKPLTGIELVSVDELLENPDKWQGKTIRLAGAVTDMCFHRRAWYGIANKSRKKVVRVMTGKSGFLVPENAVGSQSIAEGQVKIITLQKEDIAHYKKTHKFISDKDLQSDGPIRQPIVIASGAQFKR